MQDKLDLLNKEIYSVKAEIKLILGREFIFLIYAHHKEIQENDEIWLMDFMQSSISKNLTVILHGEGGDFKTAIIMAYILRENLSSFQVYVPVHCCSSLCCLFLKADELTLTPNTVITQIDPVCQYEGGWFRAIKHIKSEDPLLKENAKQIFNFAKFKIMGMINTKPSLFKFKHVEYDDFGHTHEVVSLFMNKDRHDSRITLAELQYLDLNVVQSQNADLLAKTTELINKCQSFLTETNKRVMLISSEEIKKGDISGTIIIPSN